MTATDAQVRILMRERKKGRTQEQAAAKANLKSPKTTAKYERLGLLPSQLKKPRTYRTRPDAFAEDWPQIEQMLSDAPELEAKALFEWLQEQQPGKYQETQLRTFQRRVTRWRALNQSQIEGIEAGRPNQIIDRYPHIFPEGAYCWLVDSNPRLQALAEDAIDTVRVLRAADALRKRGSVLRTSGQYQIFVDQYRGNAVYALQLGDNQLYLLELHDEISAGEANIACSELEQEGYLRVSFHRGSFGAPGAKEQAAHAAATVVNDIQSDVIGSFYRSTELIGLKPASEMLILLEATEDDISFPKMVRDALFKLNPDIEIRVEVTPSLKYVHAQERERYLTAKPITWDSKTRCELLARVARSGYPTERIDPQHAFDDVRLATLEVGEVLIEARAPSSFVYLPLGPGLKITPLGEYRSFFAQPWMLLGITGIIRGAERNASIVAQRGLQVLIIPKSTYLTWWHHTLSLEAFRKAIAQAVGSN